MIYLANRKIDYRVKAIFEIITARTDSGAVKVWSPAEPLEELKEAVGKIDTKQLERTHNNTSLINAQLGEVIHVLIVVKNALEKKSAN